MPRDTLVDSLLPHVSFFDTVTIPSKVSPIIWIALKADKKTITKM